MWSVLFIGEWEVLGGRWKVAYGTWDVDVKWSPRKVLYINLNSRKYELNFHNLDLHMLLEDSDSIPPGLYTHGVVLLTFSQRLCSA